MDVIFLETLNLLFSSKFNLTGTGASCIYPILAARKNGWTMLATEVNKESIKFARQNISRNSLDTNITLIENISEADTLSIIGTKTADFSMCNPPFFDEETPSSIVPSNNSCKNRTGKRAMPNNAHTGSGTELATSGGEVDFVSKMICDSLSLKSNIKVFTSMLGHKSSMIAIQSKLKSHGITNVCTTEFCQGRTTRWGIAWSFRKDILLRIVPSYGQHSEVNRKIMTFAIEENGDVRMAHQKLCTILGSLDDVYLRTELIDNNSFVGRMVAYKNSWSKQRRKRRAETSVRKNTTNKLEPMEDVRGSSSDTEKELMRVKSPQIMEPTEKLQSIAHADAFLMTNECQSPLLQLSVIIRKYISEDDDVFNASLVLELEYLNGSAGVDGVHQVLQFIINRWN